MFLRSLVVGSLYTRLLPRVRLHLPHASRRIHTRRATRVAAPPRRALLLPPVRASGTHARHTRLPIPSPLPSPPLQRPPLLPPSPDAHPEARPGIPNAIAGRSRLAAARAPQRDRGGRGLRRRGLAAWRVRRGWMRRARAAAEEEDAEGVQGLPQGARS